LIYENNIYLRLAQYEFTIFPLNVQIFSDDFIQTKNESKISLTWFTKKIEENFNVLILIQVDSIFSSLGIFAKAFKVYRDIQTIFSV